MQLNTTCNLWTPSVKKGQKKKKKKSLMDSLLLLLCTPELRLKNCKIFSMKRRKLAKNWQRVQEVGNIQSDSKSKVNVGDKVFVKIFCIFEL